jgi:hypothetical protein
VHYDSYLFIERIKLMHWPEMLTSVDAALGAIRKYPSAYKRAGLFHPGDDTRFLAFLLATRDYLLAEGRLRPLGIDNSMLLLLKPLCEGLVAKGRFPPQRLDIFADLDLSRVDVVSDWKEFWRNDRA